ncbi:MAG: hypothetical protein KF729_27750 [Sandaracinaceae bacterium]|nr:hypothetical protein [Sandaracinaceae bacterium]
MTSTRACVPLLVLALLALAGPAAAQQGLGGRLDDPTGRTPTRARAAPSEAPAAPPATGGARSDAEVPAPPPAGYRVEVPEPPGVDGPRSETDARISDRLRMLDASFNILGAQGLNYTNAVLSLIIGSAQVVVGSVFLEIGPPWDFIAPIFMVTGGVQVLRTIVVDFILRPNPQPVALEYLSMRSGNRAERLARLRFGEQQLERLAEQSAILRYVDTGFNVAGAAALVGAYFGMRPDGDFQEFELIFFIGPAISLVMAIVNLFSASNAERRWEAYRTMRERMGGDLVELTPTFAIDPFFGGGSAGLTGRF